MTEIGNVLLSQLNFFSKVFTGKNFSFNYSGKQGKSFTQKLPCPESAAVRSAASLWELREPRAAQALPCFGGCCF